jgi:hypothetical protein
MFIYQDPNNSNWYCRMINCSFLVSRFYFVKYIFFTTALGSVADPVPRSGIRCLFDPWIRDSGWVKNPDPGSRMNNPDQELRNNLFGLIYLNSLMWSWFGDGKNLNLGWKKFGILDKHPGSQRWQWGCII